MTLCSTTTALCGKRTLAWGSKPILFLSVSLSTYDGPLNPNGHDKIKMGNACNPTESRGRNHPSDKNFAWSLHQYPRGHWLPSDIMDGISRFPPYQEFFTIDYSLLSFQVNSSLSHSNNLCQASTCLFPITGIFGMKRRDTEVRLIELRKKSCSRESECEDTKFLFSELKKRQPVF